MRKMKIFGACALAAALVTMAGCSGNDLSDAADTSGSGGSMARFTIAGNYLYTVDYNKLNVVSLTDPSRPAFIDDVNVGVGIETIFTEDDLLFIGSQSAMYIYDISTPSFPKRLSVTSHLRSCDPVVAAGSLAFVTLNSSLGSWCGQRGDLLQAYDISNPGSPVWLSEIDMSSPRGLAVDAAQNLLFVCDNGLKAFDISDPRDIRGRYTAAEVPEVGRIVAYDCIVWQGRLLVIGADGLYQLGYDKDEFTFISKIDLRKE